MTRLRKRLVLAALLAMAVGMIAFRHAVRERATPSRTEDGVRATQAYATPPSGNGHEGLGLTGARSDRDEAPVDSNASSSPTPPDPPATVRITARLEENPGGKYQLHRIEEHWRTDPDHPDAPAERIRRLVMVGDHIMVQLQDGSHQADLERILRRHGYDIRSIMPVPRGYLVATADPQPESVPAMIAALADEPAVAIAEPDYVYFLNETRPNDPYFNDLWNLDTVGLPSVWDTFIGTGGVAVAVFDTGTDITHPDLAPNLWVNPSEIPGNGIDDDGNGYVDDVHGYDFYHKRGALTDAQGHGTHVAGTVGAVGNNGIGVAGAGWNHRIVTIKFFGTNSVGVLEGYASDATSGMYYIIVQASRGQPIRVTNHSWGGTAESQMLRESFRLAGESGILHVAAAGNVRYWGDPQRNNDLYPQYPASFDLDSIIAVANTTSGDTLSDSSYYGATSVDLGAPGEGIWSTLKGGGYGTKSGTSMASPLVAGSAALLFEMVPGFDRDDVRDLILDSAKAQSSLQGKCVTGGRLDIAAAVARIPPRISHEPLQNSAIPYTNFTVSADVFPGLSFVSRAEVLWNTTGSTSSFLTNRMPHAANNRFEGIIPGQPKGTAIFYWIRVVNTNGLVSVHPDGAPETRHRFDITHPVTLRVFGYPVEGAPATPAYGDYTAPWGTPVEASAPLFSDALEGRRWRCDGWSGAGSVPFSGSTNRLSFELRDSSYLLWWWQAQTALTQQSDPGGIVMDVTWTDADRTAATITAPGTALVNGIPYAFIGWELDGQRYPDAASPAVNPATGIGADQPRTAVAQYRPADEDLDGDGIPDWWERFYFNHTTFDATDDPDDDGFTLAQEYADLSNPADPDSVPEGPVIAHEPLPALIATPAPWIVEAAVTDRVGVAVALLQWQRNDGVWDETRMMLSVGRFRAPLPAPADPGDVFRYRLFAEDSAGNTNRSVTWTFTVRYPRIAFSPDAISLSVMSGRSHTLYLSLTNSGNAELLWQTQAGWLEPVGATANGWTHGGANSQWHISTREAYSAPYAWFCGNSNGGAYARSMDASLYTPPITLGGEPRLQFQHWAEMEPNTDPGWERVYWDGAVVEISRNGGGSYESITPVGGYPYMIMTNSASPFVAFRPCLGGETGGWEQVEFDLADYAGETVQIRFRFGTDGWVEERGWFLDDIALSWNTPWLDAPVSGRVPAGTHAGIPLAFLTDDLEPGTYHSAWIIQANAPETPMLVLPLTLHVQAIPPETLMQLSETETNRFILSWQSQTGRHYSLSHGQDLSNAGSWNGIPGFTNLPGTGGLMSYTGTVDQLPFRFFRVKERYP